MRCMRSGHNVGGARGNNGWQIACEGPPWRLLTIDRGSEHCMARWRLPHSRTIASLLPPRLHDTFVRNGSARSEAGTQRNSACAIGLMDSLCSTASCLMPVACRTRTSMCEALPMPYIRDPCGGSPRSAEGPAKRAKVGDLPIRAGSVQRHDASNALPLHIRPVLAQPE